ncbi:MAG TPA: metal-sulfur cluster assembly factor [Thermotogaceae bacterium]|nr:metal-sulfur cluster assembly factor [Thermotogota bacterium]HEW90972.1 metal-sulfur cluster assembly factor [Thermotogaceae bacterium]
MSKITKDDVLKTLSKVIDPEIGIDVVSLGLVYDVYIDDNNNISVNMTMTVPGCPLAGLMLEDARVRLKELPSVGEVNINLVWEPAWTPDRIDPEVKKKLGI